MCSASAHEGGHVVPYWYVRDTDDPAAVNLTQSLGTMDLGAWTLRGDSDRYTMKVQPGWLEFDTYTNCKHVRAGDELRVSNVTDLAKSVGGDTGVVTSAVAVPAATDNCLC